MLTISTLFRPKSLLVGLIIAAFFVAHPADAATMSVSPSTGVYTVGSTFTTRITLNTQGEAINAAEGTLTFNPNQLQVVNIGQSSSIFNLWALEPTFSNTNGTITFGGGSPRGYTGSAGTVITVTFRPRNAGSAAVSFSEGSVLAADGQGTNVLQNMSSGSFTIAAETTAPRPEEIVQYVAPANTPGTPEVTSSTHPDQDAWYASDVAELAWSLPSDVTAVRTGLTQNPGSVPTVVYEPPISSRELAELEQGEWWFHLQFRNENGWGRVAHYRLATDSVKPSDFTIDVLDDASGANPQPTLQFNVADEGSGISRYKIQIDDGEVIDFVDTSGSSTFTLPSLEPGRHTVVVEAFDAAGNTIVATTVVDIAAFERPEFTEYPEQIANDVVPVLRGSTRPESDVTVSVRQVSGGAMEEVAYEVRADSSGQFTFIPSGTFENGVYEIQAVSVDPFGAKSEPSIPVRLIVADPGYVTMGALAIDALSLMIPLFALVLLLILATVYFVRRIRRIGTYVVTETAEAEESVKKAFASVRAALDQQSEELAATRKSNKLTKAESELIESLESALRQAESTIRKEVSDVDDIVN